MSLYFTAYRDFRYTLSEIAEHFGMHYSTISRRLEQHETGSCELRVCCIARPNPCFSQDPTPAFPLLFRR